MPMRFPDTLRPPGRRAALLVLGLAMALPATGGAQIPLRNLQLASHQDDYSSPGYTAYSSCWSYVHSDGREYAVIGVGDGTGPSFFEGTAIYNVTNPAAPHLVGFVPGPPSLWREMKQYRSWIYVVTEGGGPGEGVQIIRMTDPENPVLAATYTGAFHLSHTVAVDTARALLICNGTRVNVGGGAYAFAGMRVLSLADPEAPVELSHWPAFAPTTAQQDTYYVHDSVPVGNRLYASSIYRGIQRVFDFSDPSSPVPLAAWTYPGGFSHNAWPDRTGSWLYVTDEKNGEPLKIFDISNLSAPALFNRFTPNPAAIVHNVHVMGDEVFLASYTEGIRILDASDPAHPAEYAYADTWPGVSGDFNGVWGIAPYFPSGTVIASDRTSGLWVFRPQRNYGLVRMRVVDALDSQPLEDTHIFDDGGDSLATTADGVAVFALDPGSRSLAVRRFGYEDATVVRSVSTGSRDTVVVPLAREPAVSFSGVIRNAVTLAPLAGAELDLDYTPLHGHTDANGQFDVAGVPVGSYRVVVRCPGHVPVAFERQIGPGDATMSFRLAPAAAYDDLESATGWTVGAPGDDAIVDGAGRWVLADPIGTSPGAAAALAGATAAAVLGAGESGSRPGARPAHEGEREAAGLPAGPIAPEDDRSPAGTRGFVTGLGFVGAAFDAFDLDGLTTLTSPALDLSDKAIPTIGYWRWFYTNTGEPTDYLEVLLSNDNGANWVPVESVQGRHNHWEEAAIRVSDYLPPSSQMRLRFVAADLGAISLVEAGIDDLILYDAAILPVGSEVDRGRAPARLALGAPWPNPATGAVRALVELPHPGPVTVRVIDVHGRRVATVLEGSVGAGTRVVAWNGLDSGGRRARSGVYFMVARSGGRVASARFVLLP